LKLIYDFKYKKPALKKRKPFIKILSEVFIERLTWSRFQQYGQRLPRYLCPRLQVFQTLFFSFFFVVAILSLLKTPQKDNPFSGNGSQQSGKYGNILVMPQIIFLHFK